MRPRVLLAGVAALGWLGSTASAIADGGSGDGKGGKGSWNPFSGPQASSDEDPDGLEEYVPPFHQEQLQWSTDTEIIKRLLREAFAGILGNKERLDALERGKGTKAGAGAGQLRVHGEVGVGLGMELHGRDGAPPEHAGLFEGTEVLVHAEVALNPKKGDNLLVDLVGRGDPDRPDGRSLAVQKVLYRQSPTEGTEIALAPCGGQWRDIAPTLNPIDGLGLARVTAGGCPLFFQCRGALAAASRQLLDGALELHVGHILGANGVGGAWTGHTVGQVTVRPHERTAAALFASAGSGELAREKGGLGAFALAAAEQLQPGGGVVGGGYAAGREVSTVVGATGVVGVVEGLTLSGWVAVDSRGGSPAWSAVVSSPPDGDGRAWGSSLSSTRDGASCGAPGRGGCEAVSGVQWEAFTRLPAGDGLVVTPGLLYRSGGTGEGGMTAMAVRAQWSF